MLHKMNGEQRIAGDASLPAHSRSLSGGGDQNVIGLGLSDTIDPASGGSGDDTFIITRFQYGMLEIQDGLTSLNGQNLIKFDYGVTITAYREVSFTLFNDVIVDSVALTLSTGAVVTIVLPAGSFGYQLGSGEVLTYAAFKAAIGATGASDFAGDFTISASSVRFDANFARTGNLEETHSGGTTSYSAGAEVVTATDTIAVSASSVTPGNPDITYDFAAGGNPNNYFVIDPSSGAITWAAERTFDFETLTEADRTLEIVVIATEVAGSGTGQTGTGDTARATITLNIENVDEGDATYAVMENNGVLSVDIATSDPDIPAGTDPVDVRYRWFRINEDNTRTDVSTSATYAIASGDEDLIHGVVVSYQDPLDVAAGTRTEADELLTSPIKFSQEPIDVAEDRGPDAFVTLMPEVDNAPSTHTFSFAYAEGTPSSLSNLFALDPTTGALSVGGNLDRDTDIESYTFPIVITYDSNGNTAGGDIHTRNVEVVVNVDDANDIAPVIEPLQVADGVMAGAVELAGTTSNDDTLTGTAVAEYIQGGSGVDTIISGGGNDHIFGDAGNDEITLSDAIGSVETIYYSLFSFGASAWLGFDDSDTIHNFRRGEDRLVFYDTDASPIDIDAFLSSDNLGSAGGQLTVKPLQSDSSLIGLEILFGGQKVLTINYHSDSHVIVFDNVEGEYTTASEDYFGPIMGGAPSQRDSTTQLLKEHATLLPNYFGSGTHDNLQVIDEADLPNFGIDVFISEKRTSTDGVFATISASDDDATAPNNEIARYDITGGTSMGLFDIDANGGISVASSTTFDYDTTTSYTLEITATDGGATPMTSDVKTITIGLIENGEAAYRISQSGNTLTADLDTADPDGVEVGSVAMYRWFTTTDAGANKNYLGTASTSNTLDTSISGNGLPQNAVYGVEVTYTDGLGFDESVDARQSTIAFSARLISSSTQTIDGTTVTSAINNDNDLIVAQALSNFVSIVGSGMASFAITGGDQMDHFVIDGNNNDRLSLQTSADSFAMEDSYEVEITATNSANGDTAVLTFTWSVFVLRAPARIPDRPEPIIHDPYDADELGLTPLPDRRPQRRLTH